MGVELKLHTFLIMALDGAEEDLAVQKIPDDCKKEEPVPVYKKEDKKISYYYRGIILLSKCYQIYEGILTNKIHKTIHVEAAIIGEQTNLSGNIQYRFDLYNETVN